MHLRILKMILTSGFLTTLECTKFVFGPGSAPDLAGEAYSASPDPLASLKGALLLREGRGGEGKERDSGREAEGKERDRGGEGEGRGGEGMEGKGRREGK